MDNIFAILDAQGFYFDGEFLIRELALVVKGENYIRSWDINTNLEEEKMSFKDRITNKFIRDNITGLDYRPPADEVPIDANKVKVFLASIHRYYKTPENDKFGIKNSQLGKILSELRIPFVELKTPTQPTLNRYYGSTVFCLRHVHKLGGLCSVQKVDHMHTYLKDTDNFEKMFNNLI